MDNWGDSQDSEFSLGRLFFLVGVVVSIVVLIGLTVSTCPLVTGTGCGHSSSLTAGVEFMDDDGVKVTALITSMPNGDAVYIRSDSIDKMKLGTSVGDSASFTHNGDEITVSVTADERETVVQIYTPDSPS